MIQDEAIEYLDKLETGMFLTVNIPIFGDEVKPVTVMYMGKDKEGRYNFADTGRFIMSKEFIKQKDISIEKSYNQKKAIEIDTKLKLKQNKKFKDEKAKQR